MGHYRIHRLFFKNRLTYRQHEEIYLSTVLLLCVQSAALRSGKRHSPETSHQPKRHLYLFRLCETPGEHQTQALQAYQAQVITPVNAALAALQAEVAGIKCKLPNLVFSFCFLKPSKATGKISIINLLQVKIFLNIFSIAIMLI